MCVTADVTDNTKADNYKSYNSVSKNITKAVCQNKCMVDTAWHQKSSLKLA